MNPYGLWEVGVEISHMHSNKNNAIKSKTMDAVTISLQVLFRGLCVCVIFCAI